MKIYHIFSIALILSFQGSSAADSPPVILYETGVKNLRIETVEAEETDFEETVFSLGRIEAIPEKSGVVSSRISGRVIELSVAAGDIVTSDQVVARVESRQPGDPPPTVPLRAPLGGLIMSSEIRLGEPVEPDRALMKVIDLSEVYAIAQVPEHQAGKMKQKTQAHIRVTALPGEVFEGELLRFGTSADRESGTVEAIFRIENKSGLLRPNMRSEFSIVTAKRENVIGVPRAALQGEPSSRFVYVRDFDLPNVFKKVPVEVGQMNDRYVEIVGGLFPSDQVVTRGAYSLSFAGGGSGISLKEVLDAAHGHEHAEDGSELTPEKRAELAAKRRAASGLPPESSGGGASPIWKYVSGVLLVLLLASLFGKFRRNDGEEIPAPSQPKPESH